MNEPLIVRSLAWRHEGEVVEDGGYVADELAEVIEGCDGLDRGDERFAVTDQITGSVALGKRAPAGTPCR